jgi:hypothetical protein
MAQTEKPSAALNTQPCPHRPPCPGCPRYGERGIARSAHDALNALATAQGLPEVAVISGAASAFRHRARLADRKSVV